MALGGLDELLVLGLEHCQIALDDHGNGTSAVDGVALDVADEALVRVGVDEYFQVHHVAQTLVDERHDALDDDDGLRLDVDGLRQSVGEYIRIGGLLDGTSLAQLVDLLDEQFPVEGIGMVEVDGLSFLVGHVGGVVVVGVEWYDGHIVRRQGLNDFLYDCCLAGTCSAGDSNDGYFIHGYEGL